MVLILSLRVILYEKLDEYAVSVSKTFFLTSDNSSVISDLADFN